jgi:hypothetical protein
VLQCLPRHAVLINASHASILETRTQQVAQEVVPNPKNDPESLIAMVGSRWRLGRVGQEVEMKTGSRPSVFRGPSQLPKLARWCNGNGWVGLMAGWSLTVPVGGFAFGPATGQSEAAGSPATGTLPRCPDLAREGDCPRTREANFACGKAAGPPG